MANYNQDPNTGSKIVGPHYQLQVLPQWGSQPTRVTIGAASAASAQLSVGLYHLISSTACHFRQGASTVAATTSDHYLPADQERLIWVDENSGSGYVAFIQSAAAGVAYLHRLTSKV